MLFTRCWFAAGPPPVTLPAQHKVNIGPESHISTQISQLSVMTLSHLAGRNNDRHGTTSKRSNAKTGERQNRRITEAFRTYIDDHHGTTRKQNNAKNGRIMEAFRTYIDDRHGTTSKRNNAKTEQRQNGTTRKQNNAKTEE